MFRAFIARLPADQHKQGTPPYVDIARELHPHTSNLTKRRSSSHPDTKEEEKSLSSARSASSTSQRVVPPQTTYTHIILVASATCLGAPISPDELLPPRLLVGPSASQHSSGTSPGHTRAGN